MLVTGGASGIGLATVQSYIQNGARVAIFDLPTSQGERIAEELETLKGNLRADTARHEADKERAFADAHRRDRALEELTHCVVKAPRAGLVIYPSAAKWKESPDIAEGAAVHQDQILLLMPDLSQMQVEAYVHESEVQKVKPGMPAWVRVDVLDQQFHAMLMSNGWEGGDIHWQLENHKGSIRPKFSVKHDHPGFGAKSDYLAREVAKGLRLGAWVHVAVVYDQRAGTISHFVNGRSLGSQEVDEKDPPLSIGAAQIAATARPPGPISR